MSPANEGVEVAVSRPGLSVKVDAVRREELVVQGRPAVVHFGGTGSPILLVHGGWGGARFHWSGVWSMLARRHRVIAPELPGLGAVEQQGLPSIDAYVGWLVELLDVLGVDRAWCVGNSFGASLVWSLAGRAPARCAGVVMVNGFPMPATPPVLRLAGRAPGARALLGALVRRGIYQRSNLQRAFHDVAHVPAELERTIAEDWSRIIPRYVDVLIAGDGPPTPTVKPLLLWGAADRLPGTDLKSARRLATELPGSTLQVIQRAGHFPQVEAPEAFVEALEAWVR